MFRLIKFLSDSRNVIIFLILEGIALNMVIRKSDDRRTRMGDFLMDNVSKYQEWRSGINRYFLLAYENERLKDANSRLQGDITLLSEQIQHYEGLLKLDSLPRPLVDTFQQRKFVSFIPCQVIQYTTHRNYNYITINKGSLDGIGPDMGVISSEGIVGRVVRVSERYSVVQSALNFDFELITKIKTKPVSSGGAFSPDDALAFFEWDGRSARFATLAYIPETVEIHKEDTVVTSAFSTLFPAGFIVGVISDTEKSKKDGYTTAEIKLATDFYNLSSVYVINTEPQAVLDSLERTLPHD
ncbi:MAG: rod shape-determining protein MreC [Bacteroidia bacterium]|nr:rod shape-determining protein MreC [Bacteroidia bacterium]